MKQARIYVDGRGYQGEDLDREEPRRPGMGALHNFDSVSALKFGDEPIAIISEINIKSHLDRIMARLRSKTLDAKRIVIELEDVTP